LGTRKKSPQGSILRTIVVILIALALIPVNSYWIFMTEVVRYQGHPTTISLFYNAIFILSVLLVINAGLKRIVPGLALRQADFMIIYIMVAISSALVGHDQIQILVPMMAYPFKFATPENDWARFHNWIPEWLSVRDKTALDNFFAGNSSLYDPVNFHAWITPVMWWSSFIIALVLTMLLINVLLRKQWTERERLTYPLVQLPLDMTAEKTMLFKEHLLWFGFGIAAVIDIINGLNIMYPSIPAVPIRLPDQGTAFTVRPWNFIGWLPINFYPFAIGLGMLLPIDLSFSCWFFFWVWKAQRVIMAACGWDTIPGMPFVNEQSFGAYMGICVFAIWMSRHHFMKLAKHFFVRQPDIGDENEPLPYRTAMWGVIILSAYMYWFSYRAGITWWVIIAFFILFWALMIAITRMRAELGPPAHDLHDAGPDRIIATFVGQKNLSPQTLTAMSSYFWFNRAYRSTPMPIQLEGFKIGEKTDMDYRRLFTAMMIAVVVGTFVAFWANLHLLYERGAAANIASMKVPLIFGSEPYNRLDNWLKAPKPADWNVITAVIVGLVFTLLFNMLRMKLMWFPFHPVGYAVSSSWSMQYLWVSLLVAWAIKLVILRYGGLKLYRKALPFFLGLILGECIVGSLWTIIGIVFNIPTYAFWP
jgi:hypothetical protein